MRPSPALRALAAALLLAGIAAPSRAIFGGVAASGEEFDAVVQLYRSDGPSSYSGDDRPCTGVLVHRLWVLTASHCVYNLAFPRRVTVEARGRVWHSDVSWPASAKRLMEGPDPLRPNPPMDDDIALIMLKQPVPRELVSNFPEIASPEEIEGVLRGLQPGRGPAFELSGYGRTTEDDSEPLFDKGLQGRRQKALARIEPFQLDDRSWVFTLLREAADSPGKMRSGDSGGPLFLGAPGARRIFGLVSRPDRILGLSPYRPQGRGIFTRPTMGWCDFFERVADGAQRWNGAGRPETPLHENLPGVLPWCPAPRK